MRVLNPPPFPLKPSPFPSPLPHYHAAMATVKDLIESNSQISSDEARDIIYGMFECLNKARGKRCRAFDLLEGAAFKIDGKQVSLEPIEIPHKAENRAEAMHNFTDLMNITVGLSIDLAFKCQGKMPASALEAIKDGPCYVDIREYCDIHRVSDKAKFVMKLVTGSMLCVTNFCDVEILHPEDYDDVYVVGDVMHTLVYESTRIIYEIQKREKKRARKRQRVQK